MTESAAVKKDRIEPSPLSEYIRLSVFSYWRSEADRPGCSWIVSLYSTFEEDETPSDTHQTPQFRWWRVVSVLEQTASLRARGISVVAMDTRPTGTLRRRTQTPFHPHHFMVGAGAGAQRGWTKEWSKGKDKEQPKFKKNSACSIGRASKWIYWNIMCLRVQSCLEGQAYG